MSDLGTTYDAVSDEARAHWLVERPDEAYVGDQEANELLDERFRCVICEHGHQGHVCRWCIAAGRTP